MNSLALRWEPFSKKVLRIIRFGNDDGCCRDQFVETDLEISGCEDVVGVGGKAEGDWKKSGNPESCARGHPGEMCVNMADPFLLQLQSDIGRLVKPKKISASPPCVESPDDFWIESSFFCSTVNSFE